MASSSQAKGGKAGKATQSKATKQTPIPQSQKYDEEIKLQDELVQLAANALQPQEPDTLDDEVDPDDPEYEAPIKVEYVTVEPEDGQTDYGALDKNGLPIRDQDGYIRVADRVASPHPLYVDWIPKDILEAQIYVTIKQEILREIRKLNLGKTFQQSSQTPKQFIEDVCEYLLESFDNSKENKYQRLDDLTGLPLQFDPGFLGYSMDAVYNYAAFVIAGVRYGLANHAANNLIFITQSLNMMKKSQVSVVMPLLGQWLRTLDSNKDSKAREPNLRWLFNSVMNCSSLHLLFGTSIPNRGARFEVFNKLVGSKKERLAQFIEAARCGSFNNFVQKELDKLRKKLGPRLKFKLFAILEQHSAKRFREPFKKRKICWKLHDSTYSEFLKIASHYGHTQEEFEEFLTISSSNSPNRKCLYPFYFWTIPFAQQVYYDVDTFWEWVCYRLKTLKDDCDRDAKKAGVQENITPERLAYDLVHKLCLKLQKLKQKYSLDRKYSLVKRNAHIRFELGLDRVGFPLIPYINSPTKATIAKFPQHGIAMETGYRGIPDDKFDAVHSWKESHSTIEFVTVATNHAQGRYDADVWDNGLRVALESIPFNGPLTAPCDSMGDRVWGVDLQQESVRAPEPTFSCDVLLAERPWIEGGHHDLGCAACEEQFSSVGAYVHHLRNCHLSPGFEAFQCSICPEKFLSENARCFHEKHTHIEDLEAYSTKCESFWDNYLRCPELDCPRHQSKQRFLSQKDLDRHIRAVHWHLRPYVCEQCSKAFSRKSNLLRHIEAVHQLLQPFECLKCGHFFSLKSDLNRHQKRNHAHKCQANKCKLSFLYQSNLDAHYLCIHPTSKQTDKIKKQPFSQQPQQCMHCFRYFSSIGYLRTHYKTAHANTTRPQPLHCPYPGCNSEFGFTQELKKHCRKKHLNYWCNDCAIMFPSTNDCQSHKESFHAGNRDYGIDGAKLPPFSQSVKGGSKCLFCERTCITRKGLNKHLHQKHPSCSVQGCGVRVKQPSDMRAHLDTHEFCKYCKGHVADKYVLQVHLNNEHLHCPKCNEWHFATDTLHRHMQEKHKDMGTDDGDGAGDGNGGGHSDGDGHDDGNGHGHGNCHGDGHGDGAGNGAGSSQDESGGNNSAADFPICTKQEVFNLFEQVRNLTPTPPAAEPVNTNMDGSKEALFDPDLIMDRNETNQTYLQSLNMRAPESCNQKMSDHLNETWGTYAQNLWDLLGFIEREEKAFLYNHHLDAISTALFHNISDQIFYELPVAPVLNGKFRAPLEPFLTDAQKEDWIEKRHHQFFFLFSNRGLNHWSMVIYCVKSRTLYMFDSIPSNSAYRNLFAEFQEMWDLTFKSQDHLRPLKARIVPFIQQADGWTCGWWCIYAIYLILRGGPQLSVVFDQLDQPEKLHEGMMNTLRSVIRKWLFGVGANSHTSLPSVQHVGIGDGMGDAGSSEDASKAKNQGATKIKDENQDLAKGGGIDPNPTKKHIIKKKKGKDEPTMAQKYSSSPELPHKGFHMHKSQADEPQTDEPQTDKPQTAKTPWHFLLTGKKDKKDNGKSILKKEKGKGGIKKRIKKKAGVVQKSITDFLKGGKWQAKKKESEEDELD